MPSTLTNYFHSLPNMSFVPVTRRDGNRLDNIGVMIIKFTSCPASMCASTSSRYTAARSLEVIAIFLLWSFEARKQMQSL